MSYVFVSLWRLQLSSGTEVDACNEKENLPQEEEGAFMASQISGATT